MAKKDNNKVVKAKYWQGTGRRKTSIALVRIGKSTKESSSFSINSRTVTVYFPRKELKEITLAPLKVLEASFSVTVLVRGGGIRGQAEAIRLGLARALVKFNQDLKKDLKDRGYLTRDSRKVERKKPGLKKARRAPQFSKR